MLYARDPFLGTWNFDGSLRVAWLGHVCLVCYSCVLAVSGFLGVEWDGGWSVVCRHGALSKPRLLWQYIGEQYMGF